MPVQPGGGRGERAIGIQLKTALTWILLHQRIAEPLGLCLLLLLRCAHGPRNADIAGQRRCVEAVYLQTRIWSAVGELQGRRGAAVGRLRRRLAVEVTAEYLSCVCPEDNDAGDVANRHNRIVMRDVRKGLRSDSRATVNRHRQDAPGRGLIL